jgi:flagellar protein FlbB
VAYRGVGAAPRIFVLLLLIIALALGGLVWFDYLGLLNVRETLAPALSLVGVGAPQKLPNADDPLLLERQRLSKETEALDMRSQQLDKQSVDVQQQEAEVKQKLAALDEQQKALQEQEKSFNQTKNQYDNRSANLRAVATNLMSMPPQTAVDQLKAMTDQDVIDILRTTDQIAVDNGQQSIVPYWLSLMPADRAATISRKMLKTPALASSSP